MRVNEKTYQSMPANIKAMFCRLPNPGSEEVLELFPETGNNFRLNGGKAGAGNDNAIFGNAKSERGPILFNDSGSAARFFYCAKANRAEREVGCEGMEKRKSSKMGDGIVSCVGHPNPNAVGHTESGDRKASNFHPCVKPLALMRYLCRLVTPPNGIILDPFMGSGTTGMAAKIEGFRFIGIEKEQEYIEIAERRIEATA